MSAPASGAQRPDYGIDAPGVVRNLFIAGAIGWLVWGTATLGLWSGQLNITLPGISVIFQLKGIGLGCGIGFTFVAVWMIWDSKIGKVHSRERLLDQIAWTGKELVLDLGCGRGLMLIGAAKRLTTGRATGIDIWQTEDLTRNHPEATLENIRLEGVSNRTDLETGDMRQIPFADNTFDVVVSRAAIHNLYKTNDRARAISEIARVLKPGGKALIDDIRHHRQYTTVFTEHGCADVRLIGSRVGYVLVMLITFGSLRPMTLLVEKSS